jgi:hypothetical protein
LIWNCKFFNIMSLLEIDPMFLANQAWNKAQEEGSIYWCNIMITLFTYFIGVYLESSVPVLQLILMEKYLGIQHDQIFIGMIRESKKFPENDPHFFRYIIGQVNELHLLDYKLKSYKYIDYNSLERQKLSIQYLIAKNKFLMSMYRKEEKIGLLFSLLKAEIKKCEQWLSEDIIEIPQRFLRSLVDQGLCASFSPYSDYPEVKEEYTETLEATATTLWGFSLYQYTNESENVLKKFLISKFKTITEDLVTIEKYLRGINLTMKSKWYHQDFMANSLAMQYQLLAIEMHLENYKFYKASTAGPNIERYKLLMLCKSYYKALERGGRETAQKLEESCDTVDSFNTGIRVLVRDLSWEFGLVISIHLVESHKVLDPVIDFFASRSANQNIIFGDFYISDNFLPKIDQFIDACKKLIAAHKDVVIPIEELTKKITQLFRSFNPK